MFSPLALVLIPLGYLFLWPLADRVWPQDRAERPSPLLGGLTALSLSVGALALILFWLGLLPGRWLTGWTALVVVAAGLGIGLALNRGWLAPSRWSAYWRVQARRFARLDVDALLLWAIVGVLSVILINAVYYPFIGDDVLSRYGLQAQEIYAARRLPRSVWGYPPLAPLVFVATWFAAGGANEHLARLLPFVMAAGTIGAAILVGRWLYGRTGGLIAGALLALTPMFVENATLAYTDIPTAFPLTLAVLYALRWWESGRPRDAAAGGLLLGVALLTKQSALTALASLAALPLIWLVAARSQAVANRWRRALAALAWIALPPLLIAGPWFLRNALIGSWQNVLPVAGLYHVRGDQTGWLGIAPPLAWPREFGYALAPLVAVGWGVGLVAGARQAWAVVRSQMRTMPGELILLAVIVPYWLVWWLRFSFEARFLLLVLPLYAVLAARPLAWVISRLGESSPLRLPRWVWRVIGVALLSGLFILGTRWRLGGVYHALTRPFAPDAERMMQAKGRYFSIVAYARENFDPATDRLAVMDGRMMYYLRDFDATVMYPVFLSELEGFDYLLHSSSMASVYNGRLALRDSEFYLHVWDPLVFEPVYISQGVHVMRILRTDVPTPEEYEAYYAAHPQEEP